MDNVPDKVYELWLMTGIKERKVTGWESAYLELSVKVGDYSIGAHLQPDGTYTYLHRCFYPTWEAVHTAALAQCHERIKKAKKEIASNERAIKKLEGMVK